VRFAGSSSSTSVSMEQIQKEVNESEEGETFQWKRTRQVRLPRTYYSYEDRGPRWDIPNNDIETVKHAIAERVFFTKQNGKFKRAPKPWDLEVFPDVPELAQRKLLAREHVLSTTNNFMSQMLGEVSSDGRVSPMTNLEFLECYGGAKRKTYESAVKSLEIKGFESKDCVVKTFTKDEYRKPGGAPRAIQPRSPRFNVCLGRYIKHVEHKVFEAIDKVYDPTGDCKTVAKGMNMAERGETISRMWNSFCKPVAIGLDASRFDQHINQLLLEIEHSVYLEVCGGSDELPPLKRLLQAQKVNKGAYKDKDGTIKYKVNGCRMSGDMNTSLGNVIIMCTLMYSYLESCGLKGRAKLLNDGDDCVLIMEESSVDKFKSGMEDWFRRMGITMQYDGVYNTLEEIEFCQSRPVRVNGSYVLVPRPSKRLYSDLFTTKPIKSKKVYEKMLGAKGECGRAMSRGVPIFQSYYEWFCRSAKPWRPKEGDYYWHYRQDLSDGMAGVCEIDTSTRISFYFAFGITPQEQIALEKYYDNRCALKHANPITDYTLQLDLPQRLAPPEQAPAFW